MPPIRPPIQPRDGWGADAAGEARSRDGLVGVVGDAGTGLAGAEDDREPRLPPLPARASASPP
ncbi:MAG TPA: hypothetical protein VGT02_06330 [Methylomirabilota bacterium]|nr:hypothetical protein [Methylomirabilota bacterium]